MDALLSPSPDPGLFDGASCARLSLPLFIRRAAVQSSQAPEHRQQAEATCLGVQRGTDDVFGEESERSGSDRRCYSARLDSTASTPSRDHLDHRLGTGGVVAVSMAVALARLHAAHHHAYQSRPDPDQLLAHRLGFVRRGAVRSGDNDHGINPRS